MGALAKDTTLLSILKGVVGAAPERTAKVETISFDPSQFEAGKIDTSTGINANASGCYRTADYIALPSSFWKGQFFTHKPWIAYILYYSQDKAFQEFSVNVTGSCELKSYPYCRVYFIQQTALLSNTDYITNCLKIHYIKNAPAENEHFLYNHVFNGNFEYDRDSDGVGDGWTTANSPTSVSVSENVQSVTPSSNSYFMTYANDNLTGHKIYVAYSAYTPNTGCILSVYGNSLTITQNTKFERASKVVTDSGSSVNPRFTPVSGNAGKPIYIKNFMMIDLTAIYGEDNEPSAETIDWIVDSFYDGYVPCEFVCKYDDSNLPSSMMDAIQSIEKRAKTCDKIQYQDGAVVSVGHYIDDVLQSTTSIERDVFGNIVSIEEV